MNTLRLSLFIALLSTSALAAVCTGEDPCKACKDCSRCAHCTSGKGSCGVIRAQNAAEEKKRQAAQAKAGKKR